MVAAAAGVGAGASGAGGGGPARPFLPRRMSANASNPFSGQAFYVNPSYAQELATSISTAEVGVLSTLEKMRGVPSAYWLDTKAKIKGKGSKTMEGILADASKKSPPELVTFIVYDLPNRDCHAKASNGEICCTYLEDGRCDYSASGTCADGIGEYKTKYIDEIVAVLGKYDGLVPIVLVIEPDSLPNLSTNRADPRCGNAATVAAYQQGVAYAVKAIGDHTSHVSMYLDAGHGGWLGWKNNMLDFVKTIQDLGVAAHLRGFATNVAGYQALGKMCPEYDWCLNNAHPYDECCYDPCGLTAEWDPSQNEHNYAMHLRKAMSEGIAGFEPHIIIDTGRNGVANERADCANWCNIRGAGVGLIPTTATADPEIIDAYFWLKTPGESDGCTQTLPDGTQCPRFDADCGSPDSLGSWPGEPRAPEAGAWFDYQIKMLATNAHME
uniref:Glucanase n=1 Tax=Zooxanthella nutricula TaxID=1333877 RepID=A0A7S2JH34_9DINO|mmetsp:Transcript_30802/g.93200  ORF Transcript_30802/g.93200 Transcript_30802/m.93200 type:complete len:440 (+) Transcript_30802:1-1320(+)